jgi:uncharacterized protein YhfF
MSLDPMLLAPGSVAPTQAALDGFWAAARAARPDTPLADRYRVRCIGLDAATNRQILDLIRSGEKTGTFTLRWLAERTGQPFPHVGDCTILTDFAGTPTLLVRLEEVRDLRWGRLTAADTALDGPAVRDLAVWKPMHAEYWGKVLQPLGLSITDDMPFWAERFSLVYPDGRSL